MILVSILGHSFAMLAAILKSKRDTFSAVKFIVSGHFFYCLVVGMVYAVYLSGHNWQSSWGKNSYLETLNIV